MSTDTIQVKEISSKKDKLKFIKFPFKIYDNNPYWVPPIISQELETFNTSKNPVFKEAKARLFLAYKNEKIVGRVAAIINRLEVNEQGVRKMRFGWFDFIDDIAVSKALLDTVYSIGQTHKLEYIEGPVGFSNMDKVGVVFEGFEEKSSMMTWYNSEYYIKHYEAYGLSTEKVYQESKFYFPDTKPETFLKATDFSFWLRKSRFVVKNFSW